MALLLQEEIQNCKPYFIKYIWGYTSTGIKLYILEAEKLYIKCGVCVALYTERGPDIVRMPRVHWAKNALYRVCALFRKALIFLW